jgi:hypothetical protein
MNNAVEAAVFSTVALVTIPDVMKPANAAANTITRPPAMANCLERLHERPVGRVTPAYDADIAIHPPPSI